MLSLFIIIIFIIKIIMIIIIINFIIYFSIKYNYKLRIKTILNELFALISLNKLFLSSRWWEREVWGMFGIFFSEHAQLRRILTDYGFIGYVLRKDFPNVCFYEVRYSESQQKVIYEPLEFSCYTRFS